MILGTKLGPGYWIRIRTGFKINIAGYGIAAAKVDDELTILFSLKALLVE